MTEAGTFDAAGAGQFCVTPAMVEAFRDHGFVLLRNLLSPAEASHLKRAVDHPEGVTKHAYGRDDADKTVAKICVWQQAGNDVTGVVPRLKKICGTMEQLMGGDEIYHYHSKLLMKEARTGGAFEWHQDYGYWYYNGCLLPEMGSVFLPVDQCRKENGCLQVVPGSHKYGRLDHETVGQQLTADPKRLAELLKLHSPVPVEMSPGDALFFHSNLLHCSSKNKSDNRRYVLITSFNKRLNNPVRVHHHPQYSPIDRLDDSALLQCTNFDNLEGKDFNVPGKELSHLGRNQST